MALRLRQLNGLEKYEVCLVEDGVQECCLVNDVGHAYSKVQELRNAIRRKLFYSFIENAASKRYEHS